MPTRVRLGLLTAARAAALAGPIALAFFSGGYFDQARAWAGLGAWVLALLSFVLEPRGLPRGRPALVAVGGLALLGAWTLASITWAPVHGSAYHAGQLDVLYLGALLAAVGLMRGRATLRAMEPALVAGGLIVIGYGLSQRFFPGVVHLTNSFSAEGRLDQPLSYWNGMGELAAIAFVLASRLTGDPSRPAWLRTAAAALAAPLGLGLYLSFSRGALFTGAAGLIALIVIVPRRETLWGVAVCVGAGLLSAIIAAPFHGLTSLAGSLSKRETQGVIVLVALVVVMALAALAALWTVARARGGPLTLPRRTPLIALVVICAGLALAIVVGAKESSRLPSGTSNTRFTTLSSDRYDYWRVALNAFAREPVHGVGAGGWAVDWLRYRHNRSYAVDAHSLPLQTLAELGLVGALLLAATLVGVVLAARRALGQARDLAAGAVAALVVYLAHSPLDWDWQLPALTLIAVLMAGALLGLAGEPEHPQRSEPAGAALAGERGEEAGNRLAV